MAVVGGVMVGLLTFGGMLQLGVIIVRRLKLPQDLPDGARYSPPAPPMADRQSPEAARATAALQDRRRGIFTRARALHGRADGLIADLPLEATALHRAEAALRDLEQAAPEAPAAS